MALKLSEILLEPMHEKIVCTRIFLASASGAKKN